MQLHTVCKFDNTLQRCLALVNDNDAVLLLEDGVYAANNTPESKDVWSTAPSSLKRYILADDLAARGISDTMLPGFEVVTWHQFVALTCEYDKVIGWG